MRKLLFIPALFLFTTLCFAQENFYHDRFYFQLSPLGLGITTGSQNVPEYSIEADLGYELSDQWALEGNISFSLFGEPYDVSSSEFLLRAVLYPWGRPKFAPFFSAELGGGSFEDHKNKTKQGQLLLGANAGVLWSITHHHGIVFRFSDLYHKVDYIHGNRNTVQLAIFYRLTF